MLMLVILALQANLSRSLNITVDIPFAPFVTTDLSSVGYQFEYGFYDVNGTFIGAIDLVRVNDTFVFSWSNGGMWFNQTYGTAWTYESLFYWLLYDGTFQYGYGYGDTYPWIQSGLLVAPWTFDVSSAELTKQSGSNPAIVSVRPLDYVLNDVITCYNCSVMPHPQCFPISWPSQTQFFGWFSINDSYLWFLEFMPSPSGQCPYYFTFSFNSVNIAVNITIGDNYTLEVTILGNAYQPQQLVFFTSQSSQGVFMLHMTWGVCITLSSEGLVALQFPCLSYNGVTISFFAHNVSIPLVEQNLPGNSLVVNAGSTASDTGIFPFAPPWLLSGLCGWFSPYESPMDLNWTLIDNQITMFSFHYNSTNNGDTCTSPNGLRFFSTECNLTTLMISITPQQIVVTYLATNSPTPVQQLNFPILCTFSSGLINITISGPSVNIFTTPRCMYGLETGDYTAMLENMDGCVNMADTVELMGPSCSSFEVFNTQGFYPPLPPSPSPFHGVGKRWMYATIIFGTITACSVVIATLVVVITLKKHRNREQQPFAN